MTPRVSQPVYPGTSSHGAAWKEVLVMAVDRVASTAVVRDQFGQVMQVRCDIMRAKGNVVREKERWLIDRQYGIWTFAAILNGGTEGVIVPPESVTGLPEMLSAADDRVTQVAGDAYAQNQQVRTDSIGQISAKGDLLAGTGAGAVVRQPVGVNGSVPVADSASATGLTYRTPLALTAPLTGAVAAGRYVGNTVTGAPTTGTFAKGDWVQDQAGYTWVCTVAGTPGTWVTRSVDPGRLTTAEADIVALEARAANQERYNKSAWRDGPAPCNVQVDTLLSGWGVGLGSDGLVTKSGGAFYLQRAGRWSIRIVQFTDLGTTGNIKIWLTGGGGCMPFDAVDQRYRGGGFPGAGYVYSNVSWTGWVNDAQRASPFYFYMWHNTFDGSPVTQTAWCEFQLLGGA